MNDSKLIKIIDKATKEYRGDMHQLESAIGMYMVGRKCGWKVMLLVHDKKTISKYEKILGIKIREDLPEVGEWAHKSIAWTAVQKIGNFWKAVKGEIAGIRSPEFKK